MDSKQSLPHLPPLVIYWTLARKHGEGNGTRLQHSCLENPMDRGAWWAAVYGVTQSRTRLKRLSSNSSSSSSVELKLVFRRHQKMRPDDSEAPIIVHSLKIINVVHSRNSKCCCTCFLVSKNIFFPCWQLNSFIFLPWISLEITYLWLKPLQSCRSYLCPVFAVWTHTTDSIVLWTRLLHCE